MAHVDPAYECIEDINDADDMFSTVLSVVCNVTDNTRRYLYSAGVFSLSSMIECFPTHRHLETFLYSATKREGRQINVQVYRDPNVDNLDMLLRFPVIHHQRLRSLRLIAITSAYSDIAIQDGDITQEKIEAFSQLAVITTNSDMPVEIPDTGVPLFSVTGNTAANYSLWKDRFVDFIGNYRSAFTGAPLSYLVRDDEEPSRVPLEEFDSLDEFLIATIYLDPLVNKAFQVEDKKLAACVGKALGTNNTWINDIAPLISKGQGRAAWTKLKHRINGSDKALSSRVTVLEAKLKTPYTGTGKGHMTIQAHNSVFNKTVQELANAGSALDERRQIREYLSTIQADSLVTMKDAIRTDFSLDTLEPIQERFVDVIEGRLADQVAQGSGGRHREVKMATTKKSWSKPKDGKKGGKKKEKGKKRKAPQRMSPDELARLKESNPTDWFLTLKTIPPDDFKALTADEKKAMTTWRNKNDRAVKALKTSVSSAPKYKLPPGLPPIEGYEVDEDASMIMKAVVLKPKAVSILKQPTKGDAATAASIEKVQNANQTFAAIMASGPNVTAMATIDTTLVAQKPTVQFGRGAHPAADVEKTNGKE
jgi:hypothetical protein